MTPALLEVSGLVKRYALPRAGLFQPRQVVEALAGVSFSVETGRSFGIVGESGSGKSTLARAVMALERPTLGEVRFLGQDLASLRGAELKRLRRHFQMVFQDPYGSLDPRRTVARIVTEPLDVSARRSRADANRAVEAALASVGLRASDAGKYPHEFSGGQRQRIAIARALITRPKLIVADEPVSALDVSVQAQVLNLLADLQRDFGVTYLLISHDLAVVEHVCDEVAVMFRGRIVERGTPEALFRAPAHPYTRALVAAVPRLEPGRRLRRFAPADPERTIPEGACPYAGRCPHAAPRCLAEAPPLRKVEPAHLAACHFAERIAALPMVEPGRGLAGAAALG